MKEAKNHNRKLSRLVLILSLSIVLSLAAVFGVSVAAAYLAKDTKVSSTGVMANTKGEVVQVDTYFSPLEEDSTPSSNPTNTFSRRLAVDAGSIVHSAPQSCGVEVEWLACLDNKKQRIFGSKKQPPKKDWISIKSPQGANSISQKVILIDPIEKIVLDVRTRKNDLCSIYADSPEVGIDPVIEDEVSVNPGVIDEEVSIMPVTPTFNTWTLLKLIDGSWLAQLGGEHTPTGAQFCNNGTPTYRINHNFNPKEDLMKRSVAPWAVYSEEGSASISPQSDICWQHILCWR